ncbi:hypothetical protein O181_036671 [Austropuccinia psidii MF-1]|uniref:Uncharacterized protein n=1 Tax=Austropuccinia psidii MF-1 TaxID=1389203 RepID=A0A9Q3DAM3_9BASI|nr:hypothetical protein [Austropuccinia psidii MF-1]
MEEEAPSRRGGMKSRRSRSFSGLLGGYPGMSEGARERLGEVEDEEGEESVEEEDPRETEVADALANSQSLLKIMERMSTIMGKLSQEAAPAFNIQSMREPDPFDCTQGH